MKIDELMENLVKVKEKYGNLEIGLEYENDEYMWSGDIEKMYVDGEVIWFKGDKGKVENCDEIF